MPKFRQTHKYRYPAVRILFVWSCLRSLTCDKPPTSWQCLTHSFTDSRTKDRRKTSAIFFLRKHVQSSSDSVFYLLAWKSIMLHVTTCYNRHVAGHGPPGEKPIVAVVRGRQEPFGGQEVFVAGGSDGFWMEKWCVEMDVFFWDKQKIEQKTDSATDSAESFSVELGTNMNQPDRDEMSLQSPESGESHGVPSYFRSCS